jgi:hypothetical protein
MSGLKLLIITFLVGSVFSRMETSQHKEIPSVFTRKPCHFSWDTEKWIDQDCIVLGGERVKSENKMFVYSVWDMDSLYFHFKVLDSDLRVYQTELDHPELYLDDMVEVLIDTENDKDSCWAEDDIVYHVNLLGIKKDDRGNNDCLTNPKWNGDAGIRIQLLGTVNDTTDIDTGYLVNLSFSWKEIQQKPHQGLLVGVNFANGDNDGKGRQLFDWAGALPLRSPFAFGTLILEREEKK